MDEPTLRRKLRAVEALHQGAQTEGERLAAAKAGQRLVRRLEETRKARVQATAALFEQDDEPLEPDPLTEETAELPPTEDLLAALAGWRMGLRTAGEVGAWAARLCDQLLLPSVEVGDPRAARVEVLLQLAAMRRQPLLPQDIPAIEAFLQAPPGPAAWAAWFQFLAGIDWKQRRAG